MTLPIGTGFAPMEAKPVSELPDGEGWQYEPKWDGFRCLAFRDGDSVDLRSKSGQPLGRYFPEIASAMKALGARRCVLDGEIVVPVKGELSFDDLLQRIHPAASRVERLARETPACFILFDLLVDERGRDLTGVPLADRRARLEGFHRKHVARAVRFQLSPCTRDRDVAMEWLTGRAGTDGVIAKELDQPYRSGERAGMRKIKRMRTADCVVGGFRYASKGEQIGSLLLGLYDDDGLLHHVGFTSSFTNAERPAVKARVEKLAGGAGFTGRAPGGPSRWSTGRSEEWVPLTPRLVVEVQYDHFSQGRFRHGTKFLRWRPDKSPRQCRFDQLDTPPSVTRPSRRSTASGPRRAARRR